MPGALAAVETHLDLGQTIPPDTAHAVSVSLPTWKANVGYEEGEDWVLDRVKAGYPRFLIHPRIRSFANAVVEKYGTPTEGAVLFPSYNAASVCVEFFHQQEPSLQRGKDVHLVNLAPDMSNSVHKTHGLFNIIAVLFPEEYSKTAKTFWQHTGEGISSRQAEFCHKAFEDGHLVEKSNTVPKKEKLDSVCKGPRRYRRGDSVDKIHDLSRDPALPDKSEYVLFIEERFGRNLDLSYAANAKSAIRRRIAGSLTANVDLSLSASSIGNTLCRQIQGLSLEDVYLYSCGMNSIFNTHRTLMKARGPMKSICFGFPYIDTLKILEKFGPGCLFYGHGSPTELDDLETRCEKGEAFLALFCEFPGNPLLKSPDLRRIRSLADRYDFAVVVDETIGNFMNVHILPYADVAVSSLTKVFSGDSNVMGGSSVLNPQGRYYHLLRSTLKHDYEDNYWLEDAIFMERNSRDFVSRINRINTNADAICQVLRASPLTRQVYYPKYSPTRANYDFHRTPRGGYGGLLSVTFHSPSSAITFFDTLETAKGPSLGTNFTLASPFVLLAHYGELEWAEQYGAQKDLVRISVGLEGTEELEARFRRALKAVEETRRT